MSFLLKVWIKYLLSFSVLQISSKMSSVNETKDHHWKMIVNRKNRMEQVF